MPGPGEALDQPWLAEYDTLDKMVESRTEIYAGLSAHLLTGTRAHWIEVLLAHDVWCAAVQTYDELVEDPQVAHNGLFWDVPVGEGEADLRHARLADHLLARRPPGSGTAFHAPASTRPRCWPTIPCVGGMSSGAWARARRIPEFTAWSARARLRELLPSMGVKQRTMNNAVSGL